MKINYGLNRIVKVRGRKRIEHKNGTMTIDGRKRFDTIIDAIRANNIGWAVTGYAPARPPHET